MTTLPADTTDPPPTVTPARITLFAAIQQSFSIFTNSRVTPCYFIGISVRAKLWFSEYKLALGDIITLSPISIQPEAPM